MSFWKFIFTSQGRISRSEYCAILALDFGIFLLLSSFLVVCYKTFPFLAVSLNFLVFSFIVFAVGIPLNAFIAAAASIRRMHDTGRSSEPFAVFIFLSTLIGIAPYAIVHITDRTLVPLVIFTFAALVAGPLSYLIMLFPKGSLGENKYGVPVTRFWEPRHINEL